MFGSYTWIMQQELRYESARETLQKLLNDGTYSYKALKAYITIDDTFGKTIDKRKLRWAKRYLRTHNIKFQDIQSIVDENWKKDSDLYREVSRVMYEKVPGLSALMSYIS